MPRSKDEPKQGPRRKRSKTVGPREAPAALPKTSLRLDADATSVVVVTRSKPAAMRWLVRPPGPIRPLPQALVGCRAKPRNLA